MKVLYLAHTCPYPPNRGDRIRCYHILRHLAKKHQLVLAYPVFTDDHSECQSHLLQYCDAVYPVRQQPLISYFNTLKSLFSHRPLSVSFYDSRQLSTLLQNISPEMTIADCSTMAPYAIYMPGPKILDFVDIDSQKWKHFEEISRFPYSLIYKIESTRLAKFEEFLIKQFNYCLVTSQHEQSLLSNASNIAVLPNGVDHQYFSPQNTPTEGMILFTGVMNYLPNTDAVRHFHRHTFPLIKQAVPSTQFVIAGMHPTAQVCKLADRDTVVTGFVPDIRDYLSRASVCVVPLRLAMGVQNKVLEAMAMGVPVVATSVANRGINATHGKDIFIADDPESFATATTRLLNDPVLREMIARNARRFIEEHFSWEGNLNKLDRLMSEIRYQPTIHQDIYAR